MWRRRLTQLRKIDRLFSTTAPTERPSVDTDILIVGAGPAGLAASVKLRQLAIENNQDVNVMVIEKGGDIGSHILSGAVLEPRAFDELFPDWQNNFGRSSSDPAPLQTPAIKDSMKLLTENNSIPLPLLNDMKNHGNWIVSLSEVTRWMGRRAEEMGVNLYPGFAGREILYDTDGKVVGVATNDVGVDRNGVNKASFERGMAINAKLTLFAEGCHGSLTKELIKKYNLRGNSQPQTYGIGLKEVWEVSKEQHKPGTIIHTIGWPLDPGTYGGSFLYHYGENLVSLGLIVGLDYKNPYLNPYKEFQKLKMHPTFREVLEGGKCIAYGARALNEGGIQSIPKLSFPGGALIGCTAGFVNVVKIKGSHTAMKSGMLAAEAAYKIVVGKATDMDIYEKGMKDSWVWEELHRVRNVRPGFHKWGLYGGLLHAGIDQLLLRGRAPWTIPHGLPDFASLRPKSEFQPKEYPKSDGKLTFDLLENVSRTGTNHEEDQPCHLQLKDPNIQISNNLPIYGGPEQKFCPAGVYEYVTDEDNPSKQRFQINAQNCIHCKTCDIKDPSQNINWVPPEGGGGPQYTMT